MEVDMRGNPRLLWVCIVCVSAVATAGQKVGTPKWAGDAAAQFERHGLAPAANRPLVGERKPSRYEIAARALAAFELLQSKTKELEAVAAEAPAVPIRVAVPDRATQILEDLHMLRLWQSDVPWLRKIASEFAYELSQIGADLSQISKGLAGLPQRLEALEPQEALTSAKISPFRDVPDNHWVYEVLRTFRQKGWVQENVGSAQPVPSRAKVAIWFLAAYDWVVFGARQLDSNVAKLSELIDQSAGDDRTELYRKAVEFDIAQMKGWQDDIRNLVKLASNFFKEIDALGRDSKAIKARLNGILERYFASAPGQPPPAGSRY
jgi:hypothetical protein